ncbi:MAG TPA: DNA repair protein RecN [Actinomycetales bacterium]
MLEEMRIRGLGVIGDAVLDLHPGLTVITGETGAGKTMVVTGLGLLLGSRADAATVRTGATAAVVEGRVLVDAASPVALAAVEAGAELDDGVLLLTRTVTAQGRSRAHAGGRAVPVGVLGELAAELVTVHGQSDQLRLLQPARQRSVLDRFAGADEMVSAVAVLVGELREVDAALHEVLTRGRERAQEAALLRLGLEEVEAVDPQPGEDLALREEDTRLGNSDALRAAAETAHAAVQSGVHGGELEGADAVALVATARQALDPVRGHDRELGELHDRLAEIGYLIADVAADLASYAAGIDSDPARLAVVQERRAALSALTRKYGEDADAVLAWGKQASLRLLDLEDDEGRADQLRQRREQLRSQLAQAAARLGDARTAAAARLGEAVSAELAQLAMPHARLVVQVTRRHSTDDGAVAVPFAEGTVTVEVAAHGADDVELLLSPHAGAPPRPVAKGASGGELSRVMLGLEVVLAGADPVPTFVFDEVDAGVGGRAAVEIGRRLARLARASQVVVVTHLPQVAAYADRHLLVLKSDDGSVTESGVSVLDDHERVRELARMLAGQEESSSARAHAQELVDTAREDVAALG